MKFENIVFINGDDASKWIKLLEEKSLNHVIGQLVETYVGNIEPEEPTSYEPWGSEDRIFQRRANDIIYIMSYSEKMGYIGLCKLTEFEIKDEDITWASDFYSYMMSYRGFRIGGAASDRSAKKKHSNLGYYAGQAKITKRDILSGRIAPFMFKNILDIERKLTENEKSDSIK